MPKPAKLNSGISHTTVSSGFKKIQYKTKQAFNYNKIIV